MTQSNDLTDVEGLLEFLRATEKLKVNRRSGYTSDGEPESVAEHSWRVCMMALALQNELRDVNLGKLLAMCVVHDLGEAISGDVPAPEQARRLAADPTATKSAAERQDLLTLVAPLHESVRESIV